MIPFGHTQQWDQKDKYEVFRPLHSGKTPLRLGIVGLGGVAQGKHLPALHRLQLTGYPVDLVAVAELNEEIGRKVARLHGCRLYSDYREMYGNEALDAVLVLTPPGPPREDIVRDAFAAGLPVFSEKPILGGPPEALDETLRGARRLCELADEKGLVFSIGFCKRFSPPYANARELVEAGRIGRVSMIAAKMCQGWAKPALLENQICHIIDQLRFVGGDLKSVYANAVNAYGEKNYPIDGLAASLEFASGAIGVLYVNSSNPSLKPWERLEVFGENKWLCVEDAATLTLHDAGEEPSKVWQPTWPTTLLFDEEFSGFAGGLADFLDAVTQGRRAAASGWDGYKALEIAAALHQSCREGRKVSLTSTVCQEGR